MHVHHLQEEAITVREGRRGYTIQGEAERFAGPGDTLQFQPAGPHVPHRRATQQLALDAWVEPAADFEWFLSRVYESTAAAGGSARALSTPRF